MGKLCYLCDRIASQKENISLHSFPKDLTVRQKWINVCGLNVNDDVSRIYICSIHFTELDIKTSNIFGKNKFLLKRGAIPSMFITNPLVIQDEDDLSLKAHVTMNENLVRYEYDNEKCGNKDELSSETSTNIIINDNFVRYKYKNEDDLSSEA